MNVKCVDSVGHTDKLTIGKTYEAVDVGDGYQVTDDKGIPDIWFKYQRFVEVTEETSAFDTQIAGSHYKELGVQPLELTLQNLGYEAFKGACYTKINKYTTRKKDNEVEQLKKARHVLDMWIEQAEKQQNG